MAHIGEISGGAKGNWYQDGQDQLSSILYIYNRKTIALDGPMCRSIVHVTLHVRDVTVKHLHLTNDLDLFP